MSRKPYTAKTLAGATRRVREMQKTIDAYETICNRLKLERLLLARLAADSPQFSNPLDVYGAKKIRDAILSGART